MKVTLQKTGYLKDLYNKFFCFLATFKSKNFTSRLIFILGLKKSGLKIQRKHAQ